MSKTVTILDEFKINYLTQAQYDAEVAGGTVQPDELYLTPSADYSTSEVNTGQKWIDGKPIYKLTLSTTDVAKSVSTNRATYSKNIGASNVESLVGAFGYAKLCDGTYAGRSYSIPSCVVDSSMNVQIGGTIIVSDSGDITVNYYMDNTMSWTPSKVDIQATAFYTKTTD